MSARTAPVSASLSFRMMMPKAAALLSLRSGLTTTSPGRIPAPRSRAAAVAGSDVVVEDELVGVRPQADLVALARPLVEDIGVGHVLGEDVAGQQAMVVPRQRLPRRETGNTAGRERK